MPETEKPTRKRTKKQTILFVLGVLCIAAGVGILGFFGVRKIVREVKRQKLMREKPVVEIQALHIKAPVLEEAIKKGVRIADTEAYEKYIQEVKSRKFEPDSWD